MKKYISTISRLWNILQPFHKRFYAQLSLIFFGQLLVVGFSYTSSHLLNSLIEKDKDLIILFFAVWIIVNIITILTDYLTAINKEKYLGETLYSHLQEFSLKKILELTIAQHVEDHSALKFTIITKGESAAKSIIDKVVTTIIPAVMLVVITLSTLSFYSKTIGIVSGLALSIIFIFAFYINKKRYELITKNRENWNEQNKIRMEAFNHLQLVKTFHREESFIQKYLLKRLSVVEYHLGVRITSAKIGGVRSSLTQLSSWITLALAGILFLQGAYPVGTIYLIWSLTSRVYWQIESLATTLHEIPILYADTEKYLSIIDTDASFKEAGIKKVDLSKEIAVKNISFRYPKSDQDIFHNVSFTIPAGKIVALVGSSGSGKSTIVKLLLRAYDYENGSIQIGTTELRTIDAGHLREHIGYVEQHVDLLDDTIKENILLSVEEKSRKKAEQQLEEIAKKSRIDQFYHRLGESKFDTLVGERGIKLSGGERQRVGIARAIIKDPEILIFDEATSSLDSENEKYVMDAINEVSKGKTTIIIAHRLSTVRNADKIIVMNKGSVVGEGTHDELMKTSPEYQNLVAHQLSS